MTVNTDHLRNGLHDYLNCLTAHNLVLNEDFEALSKHFSIIVQAYEGQAAEAFKDSWLATAQWFNEYIDETTLLIHFLREKLAWLEQENIN